MGLVMRDGLERLTHAKRYSRYFGTICVGIGWPGYVAGAGRISGISPQEMEKSDVIVIWGTNAVATQVNLMTHVTRARKEHGAKIVAIDIYPNETMRQADLALQLKPGSDGALACAVMHVAFRDGYADREYMARYADDPEGLEAAFADADAAMGERDHRASGRANRRVRGACRTPQAHVLPSRLRLFAPAQWRGEHACGACVPVSPAPGRMRAAARCRQQLRLQARQDPDRRS